MQMPFPNITSLVNCLLNGASLSWAENERTRLKLFAVVVLPRFVGRQVRLSIAIVKAINGTAFVAM